MTQTYIDEVLASLVNNDSGKRLGYPWGYYVGQCLSEVKRYFQKVTGAYAPASGCGAAKCYYTNYYNIPLLVKYFKRVSVSAAKGKPPRGAIWVWGGGGEGHIAVGLNYTDVFEQNSPIGSPCRVTKNRSKTGLLGYLYPRVTK